MEVLSCDSSQLLNSRKSSDKLGVNRKTTTYCACDDPRRQLSTTFRSRDQKGSFHMGVHHGQPYIYMCVCKDRLFFAMDFLAHKGVCY